jgi:Berberine and berberine like
LIAPLQALEPLMDTFAPVSATELPHLHIVSVLGDGMFLERIPVEAIDAIVETAVPPLLVLELRHLGGVLAASSADHGAVGSFDAAFVMLAAGMAPTPDVAAAVNEAIDRAKAALAPWEAERTCFNFSERPVDPARLFPPETYQRLRRIRAAYDPGELFVSNYPIPRSR